MTAKQELWSQGGDGESGSLCPFGRGCIPGHLMASEAAARATAAMARTGALPGLRGTENLTMFYFVWFGHNQHCSKLDIKNKSSLREVVTIF